ncbi:ABC transporter ATP-binding protein [Vibrio sp. 10N.222.52.C12]|uniref:ABC transporter ATP-binding protein n=1 Tax=Vibrio sp. 10N.222.52.C12 TaxID=3229630 RepID=UPI00355220A4
MSSVLEVNNVGKSFKEYSSELQRISSWFGLNPKPVQEHKILKNINFSLASGEAVGIVGQNGAGKSTLLKMITGTLKPSSGSINVTGRISAILELGMGFHPDLTGRQNVYHSAGLMGYSQDQIDAVIDELEAFAEIGEYFDQPVRTYSSGMQMRVAFGVVTAYRPEILIVDEALSVGDAYFQHKSLSRIKEFQEQGTTLLLVSHDRSAIQAICDRAILLEQGMVIRDGNPEEVMDFYNALIAEKENSRISQVKTESGLIQTSSGTGEANLIDVGLYNENDQKVEYVFVDQPVTIRVKVKANEDIPKLVVGFMIKDRLGQTVYGTNTHHHDKIIHDINSGSSLEYLFSLNMKLGPGSYSIAVALAGGESHVEKNYEWRDLAVVFHVVNNNKEIFAGSTWLQTGINIKGINKL